MNSFLIFLFLFGSIFGAVIGNSGFSMTNNIFVDDCTLCSSNINIKSTWKTKSDCVIREETVLKILELLQRAMDIITGTIPPHKRTFNRMKSSIDNESVCTTLVYSTPLQYQLPLTVNEENCQDLVDDIDILIVAITEQIRDLINWLDDPLLNPRIGELEECVRCLNTKLVDVSSKYEEDIGNLEKKFGEMKDSFTLAINERKYEIEKLEEKYMQKRYQLVNSNINASNYAYALSEYFYINNENILESVVLDLYSTDKIENILMFSYFLPQERHRSIIYQKLFSTMSLNQHILSLNMLSFYKILKDDVYRLCGNTPVSQCTNLSKQTNDTLRQVQATAKTLMASIAHKIQVGTFEDIITSCSPDIKVTLLGRALHDFLPDILMDAYVRSNNKIEKILPFVSSLRWNSQKLAAYTALLNLDTLRNETLSVAFVMKKAMLTLKGPDGLVEDTENALKTLKNRLPPAIRNIVWHSTCFIYSSDRGYLAVSGSWGAGNTKLVTRWSSQDVAKWVLMPFEIEQHKWEFQIFNQQTGEYLSCHLPWKNRGKNSGWGVSAASTNDYGDYVRYQYNWKIMFSNSDEQVAFFHVGRKGSLYYDTELYLGGITYYHWKLLCEE